MSNGKLNVNRNNNQTGLLGVHKPTSDGMSEVLPRVESAVLNEVRRYFYVRMTHHLMYSSMCVYMLHHLHIEGVLFVADRKLKRYELVTQINIPAETHSP